MFITQISSLKELSYSYYDNTYIMDSDDISFTYFSGATDCLTNLSKLRCSLSLSSEFFYYLSKICHNLQSLNIVFGLDITKVPNELKELISLQNNLKDLKITAAYRGDWKDIIPSLTKHSNTLTKLHLNNVFTDNLSVSFIALFSNLQVIKFSYTTRNFGEKQFSDFEKLQNVNFPKLQYFSIPYHFTKPEYVMKFLENNGKKLKKFVTTEEDYALNLSTAKFCPNLKNLSITIRCDELDTLRIILNSCQYLESIKIRRGVSYLSYKEILETIAIHSPENFCKLEMYNDLLSNSKLLPEDLESFFISWKNRPSKKSFTLLINKTYSSSNISLEENEECMKIIKKYKNLGIIKKFETKFREKI
ncbi:hypothetical protein C1645_820840 [Glomus cerebriforme]|uniref:F-box domain-containing protein n=1 Tax=Glomus cerebriforme TaxID=658196 RepID=A0A397T1Y0_9GLOM|nr:hypothetical protein C1645_820840 [Glomus cerebriforme]